MAFWILFLYCISGFNSYFYCELNIRIEIITKKKNLHIKVIFK